MSTHLKILSQYDIKAFEFPPKFNTEERKRFFNLPSWANKLVQRFRTPTNKVGFILQLGYFKAANRFFVAKKFYQNDVEFVARRLGIAFEDIYFGSYKERTLMRHQEIILGNLGFQKFDDKSRRFLMKEALSLSSNQIKPRLMFMSLVDFLREKRIEVPSYYALSEAITDVLKRSEKKLLDSIEKYTTLEGKNLLDELLKPDAEYLTEEKRDLKIKRYKLTLLKKSNQSTKPSRVRENITDLECLKTLYKEFEPVINRVDLAPEIIQFYAQVVIKSQVFQISRRENRRHLFLLAFVIHQYYRLNDVLIEILMQAVQTALNTSVKEHKEHFYDARRSRHQLICDLTGTLDNHVATLEKIEQVIQEQDSTDAEKVTAVKVLLSGYKSPDYTEVKDQLALLRKESSQILKDEDYYNILESRSVKLQNRVSAIVRHLDFDKETSNKKIIRAIEYYKKKDGVLGADTPVDFLEAEEQAIVFDEKGKIRISLYKVLLFKTMASAIKSGALNLHHSYKYRSFDDYLIPQSVWKASKKELLQRAGLEGFENFQELEPELKKALEAQYRTTNENIDSGKNPYAKVDDKGKLTVSTPKVEKEVSHRVAELFPQNRFISLFEVLTTVNRLSNFSDCFEHWQIKHNREKPEEKTFFAGVMGYGCNLGIRKIAKISRNINQNELENTVNWYFTNENLIQANDRILKLSERLQLLSLFKKESVKTHTSSDGQKFNISVDSLNANYSFKGL